MGKKNDRLNLIRKIISEELVGSQEELIKHLASYGVCATQSTLSRDFKEINISKTPHREKGYIYVLPSKIGYTHDIATSRLSDAINGVKYSGNMAVVSTKSGYASAVGVVIDNINSPDILGTIAGDNVVMMVLKEGTDYDSIDEMLLRAFPAI